MKELLHRYRGNLSNKLESQLRQPPLYFAVIHANEELGYEMAKELIVSGANPNFKDANEQTVMFYCCRDGKRKLTEYLISEGVKLDEEDLYGQTPLFYVASENRLNLLDLFNSESIVIIYW
jgi:ankyrin repeat protein